MNAPPRHEAAALVAAVRAGGRRGSARCPAHDDVNPSLSVSAGRSGGVVLHCHAACTTADVVAALGLSMADLAAPNTGDDWTPFGPAVATYTYTDEAGSTLFGVARTADKQFPQWRPDPSKKHGRRWSVNGTRRVLYRLPQVLAAARADKTVYIVEGEKDVHSIERAGAVATCNPGGAGKWRSEYAESLRGARVVVVADRDEPGQRHAAEVAASLVGVAASVRVVEAADGKDATDHLGARRSLDELVAVDLDTVPRDAAEPTDVDNLPEVQVEPYAQETVAEALTRPPPPAIVDGLVPGGGRLVDLIASRGLGKSMLILSLALACYSGHRGWLGHRLRPVPALFVPLEGPYTVAPRATAWAEEHGAEVTGFPYVVESRLGLLSDRGARLIATIRQHGAGLVVLDAWRQLLEGASDEDREVAPALLDVVQHVAAETSATVVLLHNSGWGATGRARGLSMFEDAADVVLTLAGDAGVVKVETTKNRLGPPAGPWWFTLAPDGVPRRADAHVGSDERAERLELDVVDFLRAHPDGVTRTVLRNGVQGRAVDVVAAVGRVVDSGTAEEVYGPRGSVTVRLRTTSHGPGQQHCQPLLDDPVRPSPTQSGTGSPRPSPQSPPLGGLGQGGEEDREERDNDGTGSASEDAA